MVYFDRMPNNNRRTARPRLAPQTMNPVQADQFLAGLPGGIGAPIPGLPMTPIPQEQDELPKVGQQLSDIPRLSDNLGVPYADYRGDFEMTPEGLTSLPQQDGTLRTNVSVTPIQKKTYDNALDDTGKNKGTGLNQEKEAQESAINTQELIGATLMDLGNIMANKDPTQLNQIQKNLQRDKELQMRLEQQNKAHQQKMQAAILNRMSETATGNEKKVIDATKEGGQMATTFRNNLQEQKFQAMTGYAKNAIMNINDPNMSNAEKAATLINFSIKSIDPNSAILNAEQMAKKGALDAYQDASGVTVPRAIGQYWNKLMTGSDLTEGDIEALGREVYNSFASADSQHQERFSALEEEVEARNKPRDDYSKIPTGTYGKRYNSEPIHKEFKTFFKGGKSSTSRDKAMSYLAGGGQ